MHVYSICFFGKCWKSNLSFICNKLQQGNTVWFKNSERRNSLLVLLMDSQGVAHMSASSNTAAHILKIKSMF